MLDWFEETNVYFNDNFGLMGQLTFNLILFSFLFLIFFKISKATFDFVFYVIIPSVVLSFLTSFVLPYTFVTALPFCLGLLIIVNIFRFV
ncbi:MAG: hypothetical protein ACE5KJ_05270 [Candidatus Zixiibacteriota bacterium]